MHEKASTYLKQLCVEIPERSVGSAGNKAATDLFARCINSFGFDTQMPAFECFDWRETGAVVSVEGETFEAQVSPFSLDCCFTAFLCRASSLESLQTVSAPGKILLLDGEIAKEPLMPKNFPFYNPEEHRHIIHLLETRGFKAVIAATAYHPEMAGGAYPFPLLEDGDFTLPSVYMTEAEGEKLAHHTGQEVFLEIKAEREASHGGNVVARTGNSAGPRVVFFAHIDSKKGTPGAIDNAAGVIVLLLLAERLTGYEGNLQIELVALNGEDYYSSPGEVLYLEQNRGRFDQIMLGVNIDGVGYHQGDTAFSLYDCSELMAATVHKIFVNRLGIIEGEPWYQGDHGLFLQNGRPALAVTSERLTDIISIAHTPRDKPALVDCAKLGHLADALHELILELDRATAG